MKQEGKKALTDEQMKGAKAWNDLIREKVGQAVGATLDGDFVAANYTPGFNYVIRQTAYNPDSLAALNTRVEQADGIPVLKDNYQTLYKNVIDSLEYGYSSADQEKMNEEAAALSSMTASIIDEYRCSDLSTSAEESVTIGVIMQKITEATGTDYLTLDTIKYPQYANLCNLLKSYAMQASFTSKMQSQWYKAYSRLQAISSHIAVPAKENGAFQTDGGNYVCGWNGLPEPSQLRSRLNGESSVSFTIEGNSFSESDSNFTFESNVTCRVPFAWFLSVVSVSHKHDYDLMKYASSGATLSITIKYEGITQIAAIPQPLSDDNATGWFAADILEEAACKSGKDATGYRLNGGEFSASQLFGKEGQLRRMKTFVLSRQPSVELTFSKFDFSEISESFSQGTQVKFSLLGGLISGTHENGYTFSDYSYDEASEQTVIKIVPAPLADAGASSKQTAYVLGGAVEYFTAEAAEEKILFAEAEASEAGKRLALTAEEEKNLFVLYRENEEGDFTYAGLFDRASDSSSCEGKTIAVPLRSAVVGEKLFHAGDVVYNVLGSRDDKPNGEYKNRSWINVWSGYMTKNGLNPKTLQCYVAGSGGISCNRLIYGGHLVTSAAQVSPSRGAGNIYIVPICNAHNNVSNTGAMQICANVYGVELDQFLNKISLAKGYAALMREVKGQKESD